MRLLICLASAASLLGQQPIRARSASNNIVMVRSGGSYLGVAVVEIEGDRARALKLREERGVEVKVVDEGSPAAKAGVKADDVVQEFNGQHVEGTAQFIRMVAETPPGRKVTLGVIRAGSVVSLPVTLEARSGSRMEALRNEFRLNGSEIILPPLPPMPPVAMPDLPRATMFWRTGALGIETEALNPQMADFFGVKQGVLVRMVNRDSPAERAGLKAGDVIVKADGQPVAETRQITSLLRTRKSLSLGVVRSRKELSVDVLLN